MMYGDVYIDMICPHEYYIYCIDREREGERKRPPMKQDIPCMYSADPGDDTRSKGVPLLIISIYEYLSKHVYISATNSLIYLVSNQKSCRTSGRWHV